MEKFNYSKEIKELGISYLGGVGQSAKMMYSYNKGTLTYCLYLLPWNLSGHQVCPNGQVCHESCLNLAGRNRGDAINAIDKTSDILNSMINRSRMKKTKLFFENRPLFMRLLIHEIKRAKARAERLGMEFSIRLNGTSDITPMLFKDPESGKNILELCPDVQFYDYSKRPSAIREAKMFSNYDVTFSYDGTNEKYCREFLKQGGKVAVVFFCDLPKYFAGYKVEDGNGWDMRYLNSPGTVIGLHYHKTANDYKVDPKDGKRKFQIPDSPFIIKINDERNEWF